MNTLLVFAKAPRAAKSRLRSAISDAQVTALADAFLRDTLEQAGRPGDLELRLLYTPDAAGADLKTLVAECGLADRLEMHVQVGSTLGDRLHHAFEAAFDDGAQAVVAIGSDAPTVGAELISQAFDVLNLHQAVIGPAADGGYYLIGLTGPLPALWQGVSWSTGLVVSQTIDRLERLGVAYHLLPEVSDVDTPADLETLRYDLETLRAAGRTDIARHTGRVLALLDREKE